MKGSQYEKVLVQALLPVIGCPGAQNKGVADQHPSRNLLARSSTVVLTSCDEHIELNENPNRISGWITSKVLLETLRAPNKTSVIERLSTKSATSLNDVEVSRSCTARKNSLGLSRTKPGRNLVM